MLKPYLTLVLLLITCLFSTYSLAEEATQQDPAFAYYTIEPEITTNISSNKGGLSYLQVRIDLMVADNTYIAILEKHDPLIRSTLVDIIGQQSLEQLKTLTGREKLRLELLDRLNSILLVETGKTIITDLLFTKYLYQ